jgi:uncharacterized lipoprotein YmbA
LPAGSLRVQRACKPTEAPPGSASIRCNSTCNCSVGCTPADADPGGASVGLQARWTLSDPAGKLPARVQEVALSAPATATTPDALVAAHRRVLWLLAQRIAASVATP